MANILVIDDEKHMISSIRRMLGFDEHDVCSSPDGTAGMRLLEKHLFDLVITDIIMPNMDGIEIIEQIKEKYPLLKILAISGGGGIKGDECLLLAKKVGADKVLPKPLNFNEFTAAVDELLSLGNNIKE